MPVTCQVTFVFNQLKQGWSESWYTTIENMALARTRALNAALARLKMCGTGTRLEAIRVSDVAVLGDSYVDPMPASQTSFPADNDYSTNAVYVQARSTSLYRRAMWMRGLPDDWVKWDPILGRFVLIPAVLTAVDNFKKNITTAPVFQLRVISKAGQGTTGLPLGVPPFAAGPNDSTVVSVVGSLASVGETIRLQRVQGPDALAINGVWTVIAVTGTTVTISLPWSSLDTPAGNIAGFMRTRKIIYADIDDLQAQRVSKRDTGRAFFVPRGRAKKRG